MSHGIIYQSTFKDARGVEFTVNIKEEGVIDGLELSGDEFDYRLGLVIDSDKVPSDQSNFLAYLPLSLITEATFWSAITDPNGGDIRMALSDGTQIPAYVADIDVQGEEGIMWFRITGTLSSATDTTVYIYFGSSGLTAPAPSATYGRDEVFQDFQYFLGMDADPSSGSLTDWTGNLGNWTIENMVAGDKVLQTNGMSAYEFGGPGSNERVYKDGNFFSNPSGAVTAVIKVNSLLAANGVEVLWGYGGSGDTANPGFLTLQKRRNNSWFGDNDNHWGWVCRPEGEATAEIKGSASAITNGSTSLVSVVRRLNNDPDFYVNGVFQTLVNTQQRNRTYFDNVGVAAVGTPRLAVGNSYTDGGWGSNDSPDTIGPVFQESNIPSADLQATRSNNYMDAETFYSLGDLEQPGDEIETLLLAANPVEIEYGTPTEDKYVAIIPSICTVNVVVETNFDYREFIDPDEEKYLIEILKGEDTFWVGPMTQETFIEQYRGTPYILQLRATDGLGRLKNIEGPSSFNTSLKTIASTISDAINELHHIALIEGIIEAVNVYEGSQASTSTDSPFLQTQVDVSNYAGFRQNKDRDLTYWEILEAQLTSFGARMYFSYEDTLNGWYLVVERVNEKFDADPTIRLYTTAYVYDSAPNLDWGREFETNSAAADEYNAIIPAFQDQVLQFIRGATNVRLKFNTGEPRGDVNNALPDGYFEHKQVGSAWSSPTSLNIWSVGGSGSIARIDFPFPPTDGFGDQWGVRHTTQGITRYIENDLPAVYFAGPNNDNPVAFSFRLSYEASLTDPANISTSYTINVYPLCGMEIRITDGVDTYYLQNDAANGWEWVDPLTTPITFRFTECAARREGEKFAGLAGGSGTFNPVGVGTYEWDRFQEFNIPGTVPPIEGDIYIRLKAFDTTGSSPSNNQRQIIDVMANTFNEACTPIYRQAVVKILSTTGFEEDKTVIFELANPNNVSGPDFVKETIHGDARDGAGLNTGTLYDQAGAPTSSWDREGETEGLSLLKIVVNEYLANYLTPTFRLSGTYRYGDVENMLFLGRFLLSEGITDRYLLPSNLKYNLQECIVRGEWLQNLGSFTTYQPPTEDAEIPAPEYPTPE